MVWPHHAFVVHARVHKKFIEGDILLGVSSDQIVKLQTGDCEHGLVIKFCVVKAVQEMNSAGTRGRQAHTKPAGEFGIAARHESRRLFMAHLDEMDFVLMSAKSFHDSIYSISGGRRRIPLPNRSAVR